VFVPLGAPKGTLTTPQVVHVLLLGVPDLIHNTASLTALGAKWQQVAT